MKSIFVAVLNYIRPLEEVNEKREEHLSFIRNYIQSGKFLMAGRQTPPAGGAIIAHNLTREELKEILINDPYYVNKLAEHTIIEFTPGMYAENLEQFLENLK